jgi:hypothetical protein
MRRVAAEAYRALQADPAQARLLEAVDRVIDRIEADPTAPDLSRRVLPARRWGANVRIVEIDWSPDDYWVGWEFLDDGSPRIAYLGPGWSSGGDH